MPVLLTWRMLVQADLVKIFDLMGWPGPVTSSLRACYAMSACAVARRRSVLTASALIPGQQLHLQRRLCRPRDALSPYAIPTRSPVLTQARYAFALRYPVLTEAMVLPDRLPTARYSEPRYRGEGERAEEGETGRLVPAEEGGEEGGRGGKGGRGRQRVGEREGEAGRQGGREREEGRGRKKGGGIE
eukprot:1741134-Rhodomonas_salina.2